MKVEELEKRLEKLKEKKKSEDYILPGGEIVKQLGVTKYVMCKLNQWKKISPEGATDDETLEYMITTVQSLGDDCE